MMHQTQEFNYADGENCQVIELPYEGEELSMVILLPKLHYFEDFESSLDAELLKALLDDLSVQEVKLTMPGFKFEGESFSIKDLLSDMGMPIAFTFPDADFSGIDGTRDLFIGDVIHKAFISVNEAGTEAAAATAVIGCTGISISPSITLNHPFIYLIRDIETGAVLFMGRVMDPSV